jgi:hypothetical protein
MSFRKAAGVGVLAFGIVAAAAHADAEQDRGRRGSGHSPRVAVPRVAVRRPLAPRYVPPPVVGVRPYGHLAYGPVHRPGIGFGLYIGTPYGYGYPVYGHPVYGHRYFRAYPYPYAYPYLYPYPYAYGYLPPITGGIYAVPPPNANYGGVRLDVSPREAAVYVDGYYAGIVDDFDGNWQRVALEPGVHRFEIVAPGHETLNFEVSVRPSQAIRYRGELPRVAP